MDNRLGLPSNTVLADCYRIERVIGSGGFGITYRAQDLDLKITVAVKEYYPADFGVRDADMRIGAKSGRDKPTFEWGRSSFLQEARTLARFQHPSVVRVSRVFEANSTAYMVMDFEQGQNFEAWLRGLGRSPTQGELDRIADPLLGALELMHAENFLHRDIAPDNIIVRANGSPVLLDFGAARRAVAGRSRMLTGIVKAGYSPFEQYATDTRLQGPWTDLYALGATLYRAVAGHPPEEATLRISDDHMPPAVNAATATYRPDFLAAIDACLKVRYAERPKSVAQLRPMLLADGSRRKPDSKRLRGTRKIDLPQLPPIVSTALLVAKRWSAVAIAILVLSSGVFAGFEYARWDPTVRAQQEPAANRKAEEGQGDFERGARYFYGRDVGQDYLTAREWWQKAASAGNDAGMNGLGSLYHNGWGVAQDYAKAREWYEKATSEGSSNGKAQKWYEKAAVAGASNGAFRLGVLYQNGWGVAQDYAKSREWYEKAAAAGNRYAMEYLGWLYQKGWGVAQDYAKAREWYEKAAASGNSDGVFRLGVLYQNGFGVAQDYAKARERYEKAAASSNGNAMANLGLLYHSGFGVAQDYAKAREWYEKAAAAGNAAAMNNLGVLYEKGWDVARDYAKAREWYGKAAALRQGQAMANLGELYRNGWGVARDYAKARDWSEKAVALGNGSAMYYLGVLHEFGEGVLKDYAKAREWYEKAAESGNSNGAFKLGVLYQKGWGGVQDYAKAREWYEKAAAAGNNYAMANLGWLYRNGWGVAQDYAKARDWSEKAVALGNGSAMYYLGVLHEFGEGVLKDYAKAREWYEKAAASGNSDGAFRHGLLYHNGWGVAQDYAKARHWYEKAAVAGHVLAMRKLAILLDEAKGGPVDFARAAKLLLAAARGNDKSAIDYLLGDLKQWNQHTRTELKRELGRLAHYSGPIDERWDDRGRKAVKAYIALGS